MDLVTALALDHPAVTDRPEEEGEPQRAFSVIVGGVDGGDEVLVARLVAGDDDALGEVFDRFAGFVFGVARRVTGDDVTAEDVLQEVLISLWSHPERFDPGRGTLRTFLGIQAHRRAVDSVRCDTRRRTREEKAAVLDLTFGPSKLDEIDAAVLTEAVRGAIADLPDGQREAVELAFWQGRTHREVAAALGIPEGTAKSRLRLAQAKLADRLAPMAVEAR